MAEVVWCGFGLNACKLVEQGRIKLLHTVLLPQQDWKSVPRVRYGGSFDLGVSICDDAMQGFPLQTSNAVLAAALDSNEALQTLLNIERSKKGVSVMAFVLRPKPDLDLIADYKQAGWQVEMRELHWEKMGTVYSESSWLLFLSQKDVGLKNIVDSNNTKFEILMPPAYMPDAQSPRSTMEKIVAPNGDSDDASAGRKRIREAVDMLKQEATKDSSWYVNARAKQLKLSRHPPRCTAQGEHIMSRKGRSYHLGSHEYLRLLGYESDDDINMCLASKPLNIISSTPPKTVYKILLGVALDIWSQPLGLQFRFLFENTFN
ncbi:unnamed protein product [Symbiodinium microadriaticum]|nr:unnamed protein product [Symbiodinium microadriaticum]CAE7722141.1 unnamed protein product [Symbiodinium sp. KB8]